MRKTKTKPETAPKDKTGGDCVSRLVRPSVTPREAFEHATWKYANEKYPQSCPSILFDAGELGICLLEWSGSCGGRWRNVWYDRLHFLHNAQSVSSIGFVLLLFDDFAKVY